MHKTILRIKPHFMYHDNQSQELNSKAIFGFSTLDWRGINCFGYGYILCVDQCNLQKFKQKLTSAIADAENVTFLHECTA